MAQRVRDILLRIRGDASDAENDLHQLARELKKFDGITAEATADINTQAAERKIASAKNAMQAFGRMSEEAKVDLQTRAAQVKLDGLQRNLENLQKKPVTPKVELAVGRTVAQIEKIEAQLDRLERRRVDIDVDVDRRGVLGRGVTRGVGQFTTGITAATEAFGSFVSTVSRGFGVLGGLANLFIQAAITGLALVAAFAQLGVAGLVLGVILTALTVVIGSVLAGAVIGLTASLLAAAAAVGVLATAFAAAFGPVVLVAIAAMVRFAKILEAVKQAEDGAAEGAERVRDANQAQAAAQRTAVDAAQRVRTTAVEAYRAWAQAAEATSDAIRGITDAELSRERAQLTLKQAKQDLADFRKETGLTDQSLDSMFKKFTDISFRPKNLIAAIQKSAVGGAAEREGVDPLELADKVLRVKEAQQGVVNATEGVSDAVTRANEAREKENEFLEKGIAAYEPYTAAVAAQKDAQRALAEATEQTAEARQKQNEALKDLTPRERTLVGVIVALKKALTEAFRPATQKIFDGVIDFLKDLGDFVKDRRVRSGLTEIGEAIGDMFRELGRVLRSRAFRQAFGELARGGATLIRQITPVFVSLFGLVTRLAQVALPWLIEIVGKVGTAIRNWADAKDKAGLELWVKRIRRSFNIWIDIVRELWRIVKAFFGDAKQSGDSVARTIRRILINLREWLEKNPDKIESFFTAVTTAAEAFWYVLDKIVTAIKWLDEHKGPSGIDVYKKSGIDKIKGPSLLDLLLGNWQTGGVIPGVGRGDIVPAMLEPGEYVIRRSVAQAIGVPRLNLLNAGNLGAIGMSRGGSVNTWNINLPPAPGHGQLGDPRHQAVQLARELRRRGGQGISGGGIR